MALYPGPFAHGMLGHVLPAAMVAGGMGMACRMFSSRAASGAALPPPPGRVGERLSEVDTPALCIDLAGMDENMARLDRLLAASGRTDVSVRPIVKAHKCSGIAQYQLTPAYCRGVCCAKVCEAEAMLAAGVTDIYVSNEIIGKKKLDRLATAMTCAGVASARIAVDSEAGVDQLAECIADHGVRFDLIIEVQCGQNRCGVAGPGEAAALAGHIRRRSQAQPGLRLIGVQAYQGAAQHIRSKHDMEAEIANVSRIAKESVAGIAAEGLFDVPSEQVVVTGAGSGTLRYELRSGVFTELQPGSYLFNDVDYAKNLAQGGEPVEETEWKASLFILATVMSVTQPADGRRGWAVVDAGIKAHSIDSGMPRLYGAPDVECVNGGDEHFKLVYPTSTSLPAVGAKVLLQPGHVDPTFNMHHHAVAFRSAALPFSSAAIMAADPEVAHIWPIEAQGPGF
eukprot:TRINITY_DN12458_c0_g1_i1.p1 TRINITY_DN12458_c0_g1~~TRINITY_DN12458_c0_g1_i1.p1  ORF type:complete len:453 (+),score=118.04 TRINITY_DN12458_c0_g1_i1:69-1427(+)